MTELEGPAYVNLTSEQYLEHLDSEIKSATISGSVSFAGYLKRFRRSCTKVTCCSGSLYTLEKTIMLVSMHGCIQLVFNLLLTYPKADEGE